MEILRDPVVLGGPADPKIFTGRLRGGRRIAAASDGGFNHKRQEESDDRAALIPLPHDLNGLVAVVADGMGGYGDGDKVSEIIIAEVIKTPRSLIDSLMRANTLLEQKKNAGEVHPAAGACVMAVRIENGEWMRVQFGDVRFIQTLRGGFARRLLGRVLGWPIPYEQSTDQKYVEVLIAAGIITREEARTHRDRRIVTNALGSGSFQPRIARGPLLRNDAVVVASDGVTGILDTQRLVELSRFRSPAGLRDSVWEYTADRMQNADELKKRGEEVDCDHRSIVVIGS